MGIDIPIGWGRISTKDAYDKISLNGIKVKEKDYEVNGKFPVIDQGKKLIGGYFSDDKLVVSGEPPYIIFGDHTKVKKYINFKFVAGGDGLKVLKVKSFFEPKLFYYFIHSIKLPDKGYARHFQYLEKSEINVPPFPEQQRIVAKIEELFSELDNGIENLKSAQQQLKVYRQAVLKWAFDGKLTEEWRKNKKDLSLAQDVLAQILKYSVKKGAHTKNIQAIKVEDLQDESKGTNPKSWMWIKLINITEVISDGDHQPPPKSINGIPFITISNIIAKNQIDFTNTFFVNEEYFYSLKSTRKPQKGDVLYSVTGSFGIPVLVDFDKKFCFQRHIGLIRPINYINQRWLYYVLQSPQIFEQAKKVATGTAQKTVPLEGIRNFKIPFAVVEEQEQIVHEIESRLSVCDKMEEAIEQALSKAEALRQSILKKAFEGKLVPQDPNDEPAEKLLERIGAEKEIKSKESKTISRRNRK